MSSFEDSHRTTRTLMHTYLDHLLAARRQTAFDVILSAVDAGLPIATLYLKVIQPAMYEIGRLWQTDAISIATEHYCTAATQVLMAQVFPLGLNRPANGLSMIGCCLGSELHELGMRMVCDFFEFAGWDSYFTGSVTPGETITRTISDRKPDVVCFSASLATGLPQIRTAINNVRTAMGQQAPIMLAGGLAFLINPVLHKTVGADGTAPDAEQAVMTAERLLLQAGSDA